MMRKSFTAILVIACLAPCALSGCGGGGPAGSLGGFLSSQQGADNSRAAALCYDKVAYQAISDAINEEVHGDAVKVGASVDKGTIKVREHGLAVKQVSSVASLLRGPKQDMDKLYKPLLDSANAELANAQLELKSAQEQLTYSAETYGKNMPQYYAEQKRIWQIQPRVNRAQSKVNTLNAQYQAELAAITAAAEEQHKKEKSALDKLLAKNSVRLPGSEVAVVFGKGGSSDTRKFTLVEVDGKWKVYSVSDPAPAPGKTPGANATTPSTSAPTSPSTAPASSPTK